jgi:hypothetical protein
MADPTTGGMPLHVVVDDEGRVRQACLPAVDLCGSEEPSHLNPVLLALGRSTAGVASFVCLATLHRAPPLTSRGPVVIGRVELHTGRQL